VCKQKFSGVAGIDLAISFYKYAQDIPFVNIEAVCHLAAANLSVNEHAKALRLYDIALSKLLPLYGPEDKWVITVMNGKARALEQSGQRLDAFKLYLENSEVAHRTLGPEDRITLLIDCNLASSLQADGKHAEAEVLFRNVLAIEERLHGRDDASTLCTMNNLGMLVKGVEGRALLEEVHTRCLRVMGPTHPSTLAVARSLGI
jgi:tetratricopeptide (TPR) repeat protein